MRRCQTAQQFVSARGFKLNAIKTHSTKGKWGDSDGRTGKPWRIGNRARRFYKQVSSILNAARDKAYTAVNFAMVEAYWEIGKSIVDEQGGEGRAKYGDALIDELAVRLTKDFGRGFNARSLRYMRQFYLAFPIRNALRSIELDTLPQVIAYNRP